MTCKQLVNFPTIRVNSRCNTFKEIHVHLEPSPVHQNSTVKSAVQTSP